MRASWITLYLVHSRAGVARVVLDLEGEPLDHNESTTRGKLTNDRCPHRQPWEDHLNDRKARVGHVANRDAIHLGLEARRREKGEPLGALNALLVDLSDLGRVHEVS